MVCGAYTHVPTGLPPVLPADWLVGLIGQPLVWLFRCVLLRAAVFGVESSVSSSSSFYAAQPRDRLRAALHYSCLQVRKINLVIIAIRTEALGSYITSAILLTLTLFSTVLEFRASYCRAGAQRYSLIGFQFYWLFYCCNLPSLVNQPPFCDHKKIFCKRIVNFN